MLKNSCLLRRKLFTPTKTSKNLACDEFFTQLYPSHFATLFSSQCFVAMYKTRGTMTQCNETTTSFVYFQPNATQCNNHKMLCLFATKRNAMQCNKLGFFTVKYFVIKSFNRCSKNTTLKSPTPTTTPTRSCPEKVKVSTASHYF